MTSASLAEIKKELKHTDPDVLQLLCLRLAKHKKENKELLAYLLFEAGNEDGYIRQVKEEMDALFTEVESRNVYIVKKILRKILRFVNRQVRYSGIPQTELELRIYFCEKVKEAHVPLTAGTVLFNLYQQQLKKIDKVLSSLEEDLQSDYSRSIMAIRKI